MTPEQIDVIMVCVFLFVMACCKVAGDADEQMERWINAISEK